MLILFFFLIERKRKEKKYILDLGIKSFRMEVL